MSEGDWSVITTDMASRETTPRILKDVQDITSKLFEEFVSSGEPITDDNQVLHRLCVKLEYLLQTCMKEKSIIGWKKHYWHWMYDTLKRTRGLSDGLNYVRANKEVRTAQGRGRALIRYSLVHQTLADSFQNCLINRSTCLQYLKQSCILLRPSYSALFLTALYEINAVNFDLISKGYDLDSAWPTFASKRFNVAGNQWNAPAGRTSSIGSLGSYMSHMTSSSMVTPHRRGLRSASSVMDADDAVGSSGPPSVDQRVEDLVLELSESDQKIQEQEAALKLLESEANTIVKSAGEKQDILARVISDLESRNQNLHEAMSQMSNEFQNREISWESKYTSLESALKESEEVNSNLRYKISILEDDKRNLEDTVSARMSLITSGFSGTSVTSISPSTSTENLEQEHREFELQEKLAESEKHRQAFSEKIKSLQSKIDSAAQRAESEKKVLESSLMAKFESHEKVWKDKIENAMMLATDKIVRQLVTVIPVEILETPKDLQTSQQQLDHITLKLSSVFNEIARMQQNVSVSQENLLQKVCDHNVEDATRIQDKFNAIEDERDDAVTEVKSLREHLVSADKELQNLKLRLESNVSDHQRDMIELKGDNFHLQETVNREKLVRDKILEDSRIFQEKFNDNKTKLENFEQRCTDLQEQLMESERRKNEIEMNLEGSFGRFQILEETVDRLEKEAKDEGKLYDECIKENEKIETELKELFSKEKNSGENILMLQTRVHDLKTKVDQLEHEKVSITHELSTEKSVMSEKLQKAMEISTMLQSGTEATENTEKQYKLLTETLQQRNDDDVNFQIKIVKACFDAEKAETKKEFDQLSGENEDRKRMISSFETKILKLEKENAILLKKRSDIEELQSLLMKEQQENEEMSISSRAIENEFIKCAEKLDEEREHAGTLKKQISDGVARQQELQSEIDEGQSVSDELKAKLIQLLQEKDALWKECDELRYSQKLQEEGEGIEGKWMEDQEARYCLRCETQFTFIIRKHHCRLCGKIFCNDCSKQWIITKTDGKHERCCLSCLEIHKNKNEIRSLASVVSSASTESMQNKGVVPNDAEFDAITNEELNESKETASLHSTMSSVNESSLYHTPNAKTKDEHSSENTGDISFDVDSLADDTNEAEKETTVPAGDSIRVPVHIKLPGTTLLWKFSTDRSIDFKLSYTKSEGTDDEQCLIPKRRCNSHSEPVQGEMVSKQAGVYIFEFDNRFSRFMSKSLNYNFQLFEPNQ